MKGGATFCAAFCARKTPLSEKTTPMGADCLLVKNKTEPELPLALAQCSAKPIDWRATVDEDGHYSFAIPL